MTQKNSGCPDPNAGLGLGGWHWAAEWLERAYAQRDSGLAEMKGDPLLKSLERDPRYAAFLKKMRLPA